MIRQLAVIAIAAICFTTSTSAKVVVDEKELVKGQQTLFNLLVHRFEDNDLYSDVFKTGKNYDVEANTVNFDPDYQEIVRAFMARWRLGMLPRGRLTSVYYPYHKDEIASLYKFFYYSPDIWTFIHNVIWAYHHVNEHQFFIAFTSALVHREDTKLIPIPPPYIVHPEYFFNSDVMKQVYDYKMSLAESGSKVDPTGHVVIANYTNWHISDPVDHEYNLTYFTEDVSLNAWHYYFNQIFPFWISGKQMPDFPVEKRGELLYYTYKMLLNRYKLERLSNGLGKIDFLDFGKPMTVGYHPYMAYSNGFHFPTRSAFTPAPYHKNQLLNLLRQFDSRISSVVDSGFYFTKNGTYESIRTQGGIGILANLIQGSEDSVNKHFYGSVDAFARGVLGFSPTPHNPYQIIPSALEISATALRDPAFYRILEKIDDYFVRYKASLGFYTQKELACEGVNIESVNIVEKQLLTYFERIDTPIARFWHSKDQQVAKIRARQFRLNHKPFTYKMTMHSSKSVKVSVRIFLGPKYDIYGKEIFDNYKNFVEVDYFVKQLDVGQNVFERKSTETPLFKPDFELPEDFNKIIEGNDRFSFVKYQYAAPAHLALPKGKVEGMPVRFFVYVSEFVGDADSKLLPYVGVRDNKHLGFPLDRPIYNFTMPNMYFLDTFIYHKEESRINLTNQ